MSNIPHYPLVSKLIIRVFIVDIETRVDGGDPAGSGVGEASARPRTGEAVCVICDRV